MFLRLLFAALVVFPATARTRMGGMGVLLPLLC